MFAKHLLPRFFRQHQIDIRALVAEIERSAPGTFGAFPIQEQSGNYMAFVRRRTRDS